MKLRDTRIECNLSQETRSQSCPIGIHLFILTFSPLVTPHFVETSKCYYKGVCEHKLNKKGAGSTPRALSLGDE